jgi:hypothetical protein
MARRIDDEDDWGNEDDEWRGDDLEGDSADDDESTSPCPYCNRPIHEDAERCPYCEQYISEEDLPTAARKPWWIIIGTLLCLYVVYRWIVG